MLNDAIMHDCLSKLLAKCLETADLEQVECMAKLMSTIGYQLDSTKKDGTNMKDYFEQIKKLSEDDRLDKWMQFALQDLIEMCQSKWKMWRKEEMAMTTAEIQAKLKVDEREAAQEYLTDAMAASTPTEGIVAWMADMANVSKEGRKNPELIRMVVATCLTIVCETSSACTSTEKKSAVFKAMVKTEAGLFEKLLAPILVSVGLPPWHYLIMPCSCQLATDTAVRCRC